MGKLVDRIRWSRDTALMLLKAVVAATVAWVLATTVFGSNHATFAAFSAVMLVEMTVADSVAKAVRYTAAMLTGIALIGGAVWLWGVQLWLFPVTLLVALIIGRWHRLGGQGINVAVAAIFAYGVFALTGSGSSSGSPLPGIVGMVVLGATVALLVSLLVAPPLRYRSARYAVESISASLTDLLSDITDALTGESPGEDATTDWRWRADGLAKTAGQARDTVDHAVRTTKLNPRRLLARDHTDVAGHRVTIQALERIAQQLRWVTTGLERAVDRDEELQVQHNEFLRRYGVLLATVRDAVARTGSLHTGGDFAAQPLADEARRCRAALDELGSQTRGDGLDEPTQWAVYGGLYTDAQRLCEEVAFARDAYPDQRVRTVRR
ncbi:FUSC family protein [Mycolicibacterium sp. XJ1819]